MFPSPGERSNPGIEPRSPALQADSVPSESPGKPKIIYSKGKKVNNHFQITPMVWGGTRMKITKEYVQIFQWRQIDMLFLLVAMAFQVYKYVKTHHIAHFKYGCLSHVNYASSLKKIYFYRITHTP